MDKFVIGVNDMWTTNPELAKLLANLEDGYKYTQHSNKKVDWMCPQCGNILSNKNINNISKNGLHCNICSDGISYPNKIAFGFLNIFIDNVIPEFSPSWAKPYRYDFYFELDDKKYILEMDGGFHNKDNNMTGQTKEEIRLIDDQKDLLAYTQGIQVIRIDCQVSDLEYIKNNMTNSYLSNIFDFNSPNLNWALLHLNSLKSIVKKVWDLYNSGVTDLCDIQKIVKQVTVNTVYKYLLQGKKYNLCNYIGENKIKIICLNDFKIFNSIIDASVFYNINSNCIVNVCKGRNGYVRNVLNDEKLIFCYYDKYVLGDYNNDTSCKNKIYQLDKHMNIIKIWDSSYDIEKYNSFFKASSIRSVCHGKTKTHNYKGFIWMRYEDYLKQAESQKDSLLLCSNE